MLLNLRPVRDEIHREVCERNDLDHFYKMGRRRLYSDEERVLNSRKSPTARKILLRAASRDERGVIEIGVAVDGAAEAVMVKIDTIH